MNINFEFFAENNSSNKPKDYGSYYQYYLMLQLLHSEVNRTMAIKKPFQPIFGISQIDKKPSEITPEMNANSVFLSIKKVELLFLKIVEKIALNALLEDEIAQGQQDCSQFPEQLL